MASIARIVHVLLLAVWMGGAVFCGILLLRAPQVVASHHASEQLLSDVLSWMDTFGLVAGPILLVSLVAGWSPAHAVIRYRAVGVVLATVLVGFSGQWLAPLRAELVSSLGRRLEDADPSLPRMMELVQLEQIGCGLLLAHGVLAAVLIVAAIGATQPRRSLGIQL